MWKVKNFQVWMPMDWKLSNELNEVWHSSFWVLLALGGPKHRFFWAVNGTSIFQNSFIPFFIFVPSNMWPRKPAKTQPSHLLLSPRSYLILGRDSEAAPGYLAIGPSSVVLEWKDEWSLRMKRFQRRARKCSWIEPETEYVRADFNFTHLARYRFLYKLYSLLKFLTFFGIML